VKFTIVGAGAVGGSLGAFLSRAGHEIVLVDSVAEHVEAINARGLQLEGVEPMTAHVRALLPDQLQAPLGTVVLAVKSHHTETAMLPVAPLLGTDEYVVSLQNGLEESKIARAVGEARTIGAFITTGAHYEGPGRLFFGGAGSIRLGELDGRTTPRLQALCAALNTYQPAEVTDNVLGYLWGKLALGCVYFATALVDVDFLEIIDCPEYLPLLTDIGAEAVAVAQARAVRLETFDNFDANTLRLGMSLSQANAVWEGERAFWRTLEVRRTGIWRDLAIRKRKTEAEGQLGVLIEEAEAVGVAVPRNRAVYRLIQEIECGERGFGWHNLDEIRQAVA
jgi:2-dehydropantoate 2-reductase